MSVPQDVWPEVLRCISRFELVSQSGPSDMDFFSQPGPETASPSGLAKIRRGFFGSAKTPKHEGAPLAAPRLPNGGWRCRCTPMMLLVHPFLVKRGGR